MKEEEEEISDKGSESEEEETNRDSQSEKDDGSDRESDREQDEKQNKDDEAVSLLVFFFFPKGNVTTGIERKCVLIL